MTILVRGMTIILACILLNPPLVAAQPAAPLEGTYDAPARPAGPPLVDSPAAEMFKHVDADAAPWRADFLIGLPIGLRVQRHIAGPLWLEAGASVYLNVPAVFTAARFDFEMASAKADSFHIRPGGGVGLTGGHSTRDWNEGRNTLWLTGDVDFVWRHRWREGVFGEFGFKLGVVAPVGNGDWWFALPRAALICGVQF